MDLENLTQYDKPKFKKLLGLNIREIRQSLKWSVEELSTHLKLPVSEILDIEAGQKRLTQDAFDYLRLCLNIDQKDIFDLARITQIEMLMAFQREISELYPK